MSPAVDIKLKMYLWLTGRLREQKTSEFRRTQMYLQMLQEILC